MRAAAVPIIKEVLSRRTLRHTAVRDVVFSRKPRAFVRCRSHGYLHGGHVSSHADEKTEFTARRLAPQKGVRVRLRPRPHAHDEARSRPEEADERPLFLSFI